MDFKLEVPTALGYFRALVQSDAQFPLLEAAASLAQDEYPKLDIQQDVLDPVDLLIQRIRRRLPEDANALHKLRLLNRFFFEELGFAGNLNNYYDPDNSFLSEVLRTRRGIPISCTPRRACCATPDRCRTICWRTTCARPHRARSWRACCATWKRSTAASTTRRDWSR